MDLCVTIKGVSFLLQTGLGVLGNTLVLLAYVHIAHGADHKLLPTDLILCHLAFSNLVLLLTRCVPQTMTVFGLHDLLDDAGCKVVIYLYRITRALSVCLTCMLSVFQAATLAPDAPRLKAALPALVLPSFAGLWLLNMAVCIAAPFFSIAPRNGTVPAFTLNLGFCHVDFRDYLSYVINGVAVSVRDFAFVLLMLLSSGYILLILHRHSCQVRSMRRGAAQGVEMRAAKTVVTLVVLYAVFFGIDNVIWIYMLTVAKVSPVVADMRVFFSSSYAFLSPYFIISSNKRIKGKLVCAVEQQQSPVETQTSNEK
ncbi:olfactory receptor class A-like protein 1 [Gadus chalcogrammus]|uniref:olfactory receptor class A-like protein 1 n=1 Tax=Gadus chalcogrammus TaxID=1042646 RepID=UPI0024C4AD5D|nr:olfactory receptor class A-like protein 1 [Gadus chalcogrammus]